MNILKRLFLYITSLLALTSCTDQLGSDFVTDGKLSTTISVVLPQIPDAHLQTRAMAMSPQLSNLYLAVFDENGYLLEYVKADAALATTNNTVYNYKVSLTPTDFPTYVHFIGNAPSSMKFGTEVEAVGSLFTENGAEAYWQRVIFPDGIKKSGASLAPTVVSALQNVRLIRNFAWIKVQLGSMVGNFSIDSYCVVNTRTKGSVAPYNTAQLQFAEFAQQQTHADLVSEGYNGFIPAEAILDKNIPDESKWFKANGVAADNYAYFVYEREKPISDPTFILVKGTYTPENGSPMPNRYYKVDLRDNYGNYFPIIRNFRYNVEISSVKHEGHASAAAAASGAGSGDISTAIETDDFTNISNNVARIFVSYTDTTLVNQMNDLKLRYKFMVFETKDAQGNVLINEQALNSDANVTITKSTSTGGDVINTMSRAAADDTDGWREITISTTALADYRKSQDIVIKGNVTINNHNYQLQRRVTINLRPKYTMQLICDPNDIQKKVGEPFDLVLKVPGGLGSAMFPLEFQIESAAQSMTPDLGDDLPVVTGKSIVPGKENKASIGFIRNLEWTDYDALPNDGGYKTVRCHFKSIKAESATMIYAQNKYFQQASAELKNYTPSTFSNLTFNPTVLPIEEGANISFTFSMSQLPSQGYVTVTLGNLEPANDENRLTYIDAVGGKARYSFNPTQITETIKLKTTSIGVAVDVNLSAYHFEDASASLMAECIIPAGNIKVGNNSYISNSSNVTFTLYSQNPGNNANAGNSVGSFTAKRNGSNSSSIKLSATQYQAVMNNGGYIYVRFSVTTRNGWNQTTTYYVATVQLSDLIKDGGTTLTFVQQ
ncbi:MAG: hypothetical protein IKY64_08100 [Bacteroidaceae bacterium]|nr:hypothetical protein [Bacteroidaceae bacterium]